MNTGKQAFVVMPIRKEGTDEHAHFKALYEDVLKPILVGAGYQVIRADEVQRSGAITKEVVLHLAEADLVVADLTDVNPNVFYELGVRHSLCGQGTVMIVDEARTTEIPFDLTAYRVVKFKGQLTGLNKLRRELEGFIHGLDAAASERRDNPVHDWLPALPVNAIAAARGSDAGGLREELATATRRLEEYERTYGAPDRRAGSRSTLHSVIEETLSEANASMLPSDLVRQAEEATERRDRKEFLQIVAKLSERPLSRLAVLDILTLGAMSTRLELEEVTGTLLDEARQLHPANKNVIHAHLEYLAHSRDPELREQGRKEILEELQIKERDGTIMFSDSLDDERAALFGVLLDTYYMDSLSEEAVRLSEAYVRRFPHRTLIVRNHARALQSVGRRDESLVWYQRALFCPDVDDTSAVWFATELHDRDRHVDAIEAYILGALLDPDEGTCFANIADDVSWAMQRQLMVHRGAAEERRLPETVSKETIEQGILAAFSCSLFSDSDLTLCTRAARRAEIDIHPLLHLVDPRSEDGEVDNSRPDRMSFKERFEWASTLYEEFRSALTDPAKGAT